MYESYFVDRLPVFLLLLLALGVVLAVLIYRRAEFVIRVRGSQISCQGKCRMSLAALQEFFHRDVSLAGPVTIRGARRHGRLHLTIRGHLTKGDEQRIRNYLLASQ